MRPILFLALVGLSHALSSFPGLRASLAPRGAAAPVLRLSGGGGAVPVPFKAVDTHKLDDGREVHVMANAEDLSSAIVESVAAIGDECIKTKGTFCICVPGGSIVKALSKLDKIAMDFTKVHVFFANERIGEYKCFKGAMENFVDPCGIPHENVHKVGEGEPADVAGAYEETIMSTDGISFNGMPTFDLVLLGTGEDGHVGSLHPNSEEIKLSGQSMMVLPIDKDGKKSIAISLDLINAADRVILSAAGAGRSGMVSKALKGTFDEWSLPAGLVKCSGSTVWMCDKESIAEYAG